MRTVLGDEDCKEGYTTGIWRRHLAPNTNGAKYQYVVIGTHSNIGSILFGTQFRCQTGCEPHPSPPGLCASGYNFQISGFRYRFQVSVSGIGFQVSVSGIGFQVSGLGFRFQVSGFRFQISVSSIGVSDLRNNDGGEGAQHRREERQPPGVFSQSIHSVR